MAQRRAELRREHDLGRQAGAGEEDQTRRTPEAPGDPMSSRRRGSAPCPPGRRRIELAGDPPSVIPGGGLSEAEWAEFQELGLAQYWHPASQACRVPAEVLEQPEILWGLKGLGFDLGDLGELLP